LFRPTWLIFNAKINSHSAFFTIRTQRVPGRMGSEMCVTTGEAGLVYVADNDGGAEAACCDAPEALALVADPD
jgi:hypothetical protein